MAHICSPNYGDHGGPDKLEKIFHSHGIEPPSDCNSVDYSNTDDDDDDSADSEEDDADEPEQILKIPLSSVNLEAVPEPVRTVAEESKSSTMQQFLVSSLMVTLNLMTLAVVEVTRAVADTMLARTNHVLHIFPENFKQSLMNASRKFCKLLKYSIICSFFFRSVKYLYLNVYLEENI
ncbi:hypothetical protein V9T40_011706 [Parthenolecanium corni]|uniref:Uncharacterized protein n=1 Tax=Parthenolecanium corni TaxID=536013 RepID=A0AAN9T6J1_9HEMI